MPRQEGQRHIFALVPPAENNSHFHVAQLSMIHALTEWLVANPRSSLSSVEAHSVCSFVEVFQLRRLIACTDFCLISRIFDSWFKRFPYEWYPFGYLSASAPLCKNTWVPWPLLCLAEMPVLALYAYLQGSPAKTVSQCRWNQGLRILANHWPYPTWTGKRRLRGDKLVHGSPVILLRDRSFYLISDENFLAIFLMIGPCAILLSVYFLIISISN
jgi:hypothetical protein